MSSKHVIVHVGPGKTGSTALQQMLVANLSELRCESCDCVLAGKALNHDLLKQDRSKLPLLLRTSVEASNYEKVILSWEGFGIPRMIATLKEAFSSQPQITFVFFARRQDRRIESWFLSNHSRKKKYHNFTPWAFYSAKGFDLERLLEKREFDDNIFLLDYAAYCDQLQAAFPSASIIVRQFESARAGNGILNAFYEAARIGIVPQETIEAHSSPTNQASMLVKAIAAKSNNIDLKKLYAAMQDIPYFITQGESEHGILTPDQRARLISLFHDSNARLFENYIQAPEDLSTWETPYPEQQLSCDNIPDGMIEAVAELFKSYYLMTSVAAPSVISRLKRLFRTHHQ